MLPMLGAVTSFIGLRRAVGSTLLLVLRKCTAARAHVAASVSSGQTCHPHTVQRFDVAERSQFIKFLNGAEISGRGLVLGCR